MAQAAITLRDSLIGMMFLTNLSLFARSAGQNLRQVICNEQCLANTALKMDANSAALHLRPLAWLYGPSNSVNLFFLIT
jgi:hypothetical protein